MEATLKAKLLLFRSRWEELSVEVVGMAQDDDGSWTAADGVDKEPVHFDAIVVGRNDDDSGKLDIFDLAEGVTYKEAYAAALEAAVILFSNPDELEVR
jgi:hypothetical protein